MQTSAQRCAQLAVVSWLGQLVDLPGPESASWPLPVTCPLTWPDFRETTPETTLERRFDLKPASVARP